MQSSGCSIGCGTTVPAMIHEKSGVTSLEALNGQDRNGQRGKARESANQTCLAKRNMTITLLVRRSGFLR